MIIREFIWLVSSPLHRRTQDFTTEGVHMMGTGPEGLKLPVGFRGKVPIRRLGMKGPQKLKQNVKLVYNL